MFKVVKMQHAVLNIKHVNVPSDDDDPQVGHCCYGYHFSDTV